MEIEVRKIKNYVEVIVYTPEKILDLGLHDVYEGEKLAETLITAAKEIREGLGIGE